jgi:hypothetical protein
MRGNYQSTKNINYPLWYTHHVDTFFHLTRQNHRHIKCDELVVHIHQHNTKTTVVAKCHFNVFRILDEVKCDKESSREGLWLAMVQLEQLELRQWYKRR